MSALLWLGALAMLLGALVLIEDVLRCLQYGKAKRAATSAAFAVFCSLYAGALLRVALS